jgi:acylphosphatase
MKRLQAQVYGEVQGVGFRRFVVDEVQRIGVVGWVRNR